MPRRCTCDQFIVGRPWQESKCILCWLYAHDPDYRRYWDGKGEVIPLTHGTTFQKRDADCIYLDGATGETLECPTCNGSVKIKKFTCEKYGEATLAKKIANLACCAYCQDYCKGFPDPFTAAPTRHLLYHLYPRREHYGSWQKNVSELLRRIEVFNGRRIVAIVTGPELVEPEQVKRRFLGQVEEFIILPNVVNLREVQTWKPLWESLHDESKGLLDENSITFHAHTKGTQWSPNPFVQPNVLWAEIMYEACLDYMPIVEKLLQKFPIVGAMRNTANSNNGGSRYGWFFDGSFMWIRNKHCPRAKWEDIDHRWTGTESWPGRHWPLQESGFIFMDKVGFLYNLDYIKDTVYPALERFRKANEHRRSSA